jgi:hypothetical protein
MGPNCPNGHPWAANTRFNHRGYRFCIACNEMKAEARRNDPTTFTGQCPKGHAYTLENTLIVPSQNIKVCLICKREGGARFVTSLHGNSSRKSSPPSVKARP